MITLPTRGWPLRVPFLLLILAIVLILGVSGEGDRYQTRDFQTLSSDSLEALVELDPPQWTSTDEGHLGKLLIPRASGSENNTLVQRYISSIFSELGWHEETTPFTGETPIGLVEFTNLVYTFDPQAPRRLVLAAHFDSKWFPYYPANQFIGATDSAAPCAMLLDLAQALTPLLRARTERLESGRGQLRDGFDEEEAGETTLTLLFLDGEEAFRDWTATDSIYGARHLAELWESTYLAPNHALSLSKRRFGPLPTRLDTIDHFVLLDLLGNSRSNILSYFRETDWLHAEMAGADERLRRQNLVEVEQGQDSFFGWTKMHKGMIEDDHIPFLDRGVSILHVISNPFPSVWHTLKDDASALSIPAMRRWNRILRVFTAEYLGLSPEPVKRASRPADEL